MTPPITFRPGTRENTPLIIGLAGPTKSGKTKSAHRLAAGLANGGKVIMLNAEGAKGHQYADQFDYLTFDLERPYRPDTYTAALRAALAEEPAVVIIDSLSHMHDGPGGLLEWHDEELDRLAGQDRKERDKKNWTAWIRPKAAENQFIYTMLEAGCHLILCFRAKEKLKIVTGKPPIDLGLQPIAGERVAFETIFTLMLPARSKGVPDLSLSDMREPFDAMISPNAPLSEETGKQLAAWAAGSSGEPNDPVSGHDEQQPGQASGALRRAPSPDVPPAASGGEPASPDDMSALVVAATPTSSGASPVGNDGDTGADISALTARLVASSSKPQEAAYHIEMHAKDHTPVEHLGWLMAQERKRFSGGDAT
jgi:hypothetical protein